MRRCPSCDRDIRANTYTFHVQSHDPARIQRRFWSKVNRTNTGCWDWVGALSHGYGHFGIEGIIYRAHRVTYEWMVGPIPDGLTIDHLCKNKACVNPAHLEPVTIRENTRRWAAEREVA